MLAAIVSRRARCAGAAFDTCIRNRAVYWFGMQLNRRYFLLGTLAAPVLAASKKAANKKQVEVERPNIVLVVAEEVGAYMVGCYGNVEIHTPNVDRLAQTGVRFADSFSCSPVALDQGPFSAAGYNCAHSLGPAKAGEFLDAQAPAKPFFVTIAWPSPNATEATRKNIDLYKDTDFESVGWEAPSSTATNRNMLRDIKGNMRKYAASLTTLDDQLAALRAKLDERKVAENTLIIFTSNGGYLLGRHGMWGGAGASNPPNMYEEVVRTPLIWTWPSRFPPQTVRNDVVSSYDLLPALYDLAGLNAPAGMGYSYLPFVYGRRLGKNEAWPNVAFGRYQNTEMARDDRYKLVVHDQGKGPGELYDESADAREQNNQIDSPKFANMKDRLLTELNAWRGRS